MICDRYIDSTVAYQGGARGLGIERVEELNAGSRGGLWPDVTFLLEVAAGRRRRARRATLDRFEREGEELQRAVAAAYDELAERHPDRYVRIDATRPPRRCTREVLARGSRRSSDDAVLAATEHQPQARIALEAALRDADALSHAYLFHGPPGTRQARGRARVRGRADREGAADPDDAERRVLSGVHPDLTWVEPRGAHEILVDDVRTQVVRQAALRPFEARAARVRDRRRRPHERRVAERAAEDARGAGVVRALRARQLGARAAAADDPLALPGRCASARCPPARDRRAARGGGRRARDTALACARLAGGDARARARYLAGEGAEQRARGRAAPRAAVLRAIDDAAVGDRRALAAAARPRRRRRGAAAEAEVKAGARASGSRTSRSAAAQGFVREFELQARRARRRAHTASLDLSLELVSALVPRPGRGRERARGRRCFNVDRADELAADARRARRRAA